MISLLLLLFTPKSTSLCFGGMILVPAGKEMMGPFNEAPCKRRGLDGAVRQVGHSKSFHNCMALVEWWQEE